MNMWTWNPLLWILEVVMSFHVGTRRYYRHDLIKKLRDDIEWGGRVWDARVPCPMKCNGLMKMTWVTDTHIGMTCPRCNKASKQMRKDRLI